MLRTMRVAPAEDSPLIPASKPDRNLAPGAFLARWAVAGALLLMTTEPTMAQAAAPAAIATEGAGPLGLGALVGAVVAGGFALRERFRQR